MDVGGIDLAKLNLSTDHRLSLVLRNRRDSEGRVREELRETRHSLPNTAGSHLKRRRTNLTALGSDAMGTRASDKTED